MQIVNEEISGVLGVEYNFDCGQKRFFFDIQTGGVGDEVDDFLGQVFAHVVGGHFAETGKGDGHDELVAVLQICPDSLSTHDQNITIGCEQLSQS